MDKQLLGGLVCPRCRSGIKKKRMFLACSRCGLAYPVVEGIPLMTAEDAWKLEKAGKEGFKHTLKL